MCESEVGGSEKTVEEEEHARILRAPGAGNHRFAPTLAMCCHFLEENGIFPEPSALIRMKKIVEFMKG